MAEEANTGIDGSALHFTVGSLRHTGRRRKGVDFRAELGLLKAALLYADHVRLVSVVGSSEQITPVASCSSSGSQTRTLHLPPRGVGWI